MINGGHIKVKCRSCGTIINLGDDCPACETTIEIDWNSLTIPTDKRDGSSGGAHDLYCSDCGTKKKWIVITARKGPEWLCPKC